MFPATFFLQPKIEPTSKRVYWWFTPGIWVCVPWPTIFSGEHSLQKWGGPSTSKGNPEPGTNVSKEIIFSSTFFFIVVVTILLFLSFLIIIWMKVVFFVSFGGRHTWWRGGNGKTRGGKTSQIFVFSQGRREHAKNVKRINSKEKNVCDLQEIKKLKIKKQR